MTPRSTNSLTCRLADGLRAEGFRGHVTARGAPYALRFALTYALLDGPKYCDASGRPLHYIDVPHLLAAKAPWDYYVYVYGCSY